MAKSKAKTFTVPKDFLLRFFQEVEDNDLDHELLEVDEDGDLCVKIKYSTDERDSVMNLVELEAEFYDDGEEEDED